VAADLAAVFLEDHGVPVFWMAGGVVRRIVHFATHRRVALVARVSIIMPFARVNRVVPCFCEHLR